MSIMKLLIFICFLFIMVFANKYAHCQNTVAMYGEKERTKEHKKIDERFINEAIIQKGSREKASEYYTKVGWSYFYHDSIDLAMKRFNQAWLLNPENPDVYFGFAALTETNGNITDAKRFYELGHAKDFNNNRAMACYKKIADCKEKLYDNRGALLAYNHIVTIDTSNAFAYKKLGYLNALVGNTEEALFCYDKAIKLDSSDVTTYYNRGFLCNSLNDKTKAIADYTKAIELDSKNVKAYVSRASIRLEKGDIEGAKSDIGICVTIEPNSGELWRHLGTCKSLLKDINGACNDFEKAYKLGDVESKELFENLCKDKMLK